MLIMVGQQESPLYTYIHHVTQRIYSSPLSTRMEFYDEVSQVESSVDSSEVERPPPPVDHAVKLLHLSDLSVELGSSGASPERYGMHM